MKHWKRTSPRLLFVGFALATTMSLALMHAAEKPKAIDTQYPQRVFKFKTSDPNGMNMATQTIFQPSDRTTIKIIVQSGDKKSKIEFMVKSEYGVSEPGIAPPLGHTIEGIYSEQLGKSKPEIRRRPQVRTLDGVPAAVQMNEWLFEILIEPVKG